MKTDLISMFVKKGYLISPDLIKSLNNFDVCDEVLKKFEYKDGPLVLNKDVWDIATKAELPQINWNEFEKSRTLMEKGRDGKIYSTFLDLLGYNFSESNKRKIDSIIEGVKIEPRGVIVEKDYRKTSNVMVLKSYDLSGRNVLVSDFVSMFKARFTELSSILQSRESLKNITSINKLFNRKDRESVSVIGIVESKRITKNGNFIFRVEDFTGVIDVLVNKDNKDLVNQVKDLVFDEIIGLSGTLGDRIIYGKQIIYPDVMLSHEFKKCSDDVYAVFTADLHIGSKDFYEKEFLRFIDWVNGNVGNSMQKDIALKVKYLFIVGDLVDGIGVYPGQEDELGIMDIYNQYKKCFEVLSLIRKDVKLIICPGNHDALRLAEPQPALDKKYCEDLYNLDNAVYVSNPSLVNIHSSEEFSGFNVLLYHGMSYIYYGNNVDSIRVNGGVTRPDLVMKFLLQRRHLAPSHSSVQYLPTSEKDYLVIDKVPDIFVSGHLHKSSVTNYRNVTLIGCGCWIGQTPYQAKFGVIPDPAKICLINLKTRETKILKFGGEDV